MSTYTPGPWTIAETVKTARIDGARLIRPVDHKNYQHGATAILSTSEADARLIAAAPELLEALLDALPYIEDVLAAPAQLAGFKPGVVQKHAQKARAAIAKATEGKTS